MYDGKYGYGSIGNVIIKPDWKISEIERHISERFRNLIKKAYFEKGIEFIPYTYSTIDHGMIEQVKDINGKIYGYDHGSCSSWGFN